MERYRKPEVPHLKSGITPIIMPDFGKAGPLDDPIALPPTETLANMKKFFDEITKQGGTIVGIITVPMYIPDPDYIDAEQDVEVLIVRK